MIINELYHDGANYDRVEAAKAVFTDGYFFVTSSDFAKLFRNVMQSLVDHCKHYPSDILYDIESIRNFLRNPDDVDGRREFYIGIRENGVDGETFIKSRLETAGKWYGENPYKAIYHLVVDCNGFDGATLTMYEMEESC